MDIDFSPEKSLFSLPVVRWCAAVSAFIAVGISVIIACNLTEYPFDFTGDGFNKFAEFYKVSAAFLAIGFTLVGLCAANHRSEQTKKQIERTASQIDLTNNQITLTKVQNNFSNYYKHIEEFEKYCKDHSNKEIHKSTPRKLHRVIFPESNSSTGNFSISQNFINILDEFIDRVIVLSSAFDIDDFGARWDTAVTINDNIEDFKLQTFTYEELGNGGVQITASNGKTFILINSSWRHYFKTFVSLVKTIDTALKFDLNYESSNTVRMVLAMKIDSLPAENDYKSRFSLQFKI